MSKMGSDKGDREIDRVVERTATRISAELGRMVADLPENAAPQMAIELVVAELAALRPWFMHLIMEDADIRTAYVKTVASLAIAEDMARVLDEIAARRRG